MNNPLKDVQEFHRKFGLLVGWKPRHLTRRKLQERVECLQEELAEFNDACQTQDLELQVDALLDLIYFALGTLVMLGVMPHVFSTLWADVHRANMSKVPGVTKRGHKVDVTKPDGWEPPQGLAILRSAGYDTYHGEGVATDDQDQL